MMSHVHDRIRWLILFIAHAAGAASGQPLSTGIATHIRAGDGERYEITGPHDQKYFEAWSDIRLYAPFVGAGIRLEHTAPPEFGASASGITKFFADASYKGISVRVGDIYTIFGNGLTLNLVENRSLAYDTGLRGLSAGVVSSSFRVSVIAGSISFKDFLTLGRTQPLLADYNVYGGSFSFDPLGALTIGGSFVRSERAIPGGASGPAATALSDMPAFHATLRLPWADLSFERSWRMQDRTSRGPAVEGFATYISISHSGDGYGLTIEYKDYALEPLNPSARSLAGRSTEVPAFVLAPTGSKEHTFVLPGRYPHNVDYGDETGLQAEVVLVPRDDLSLTVNGSWASKRYVWSVDLPTFTFDREKKGFPWLPSFSDERSPRAEMYAEAEYFGDPPTSRARAAVHYRTETDFFAYNAALTKRRTILTVPADVQWELTGDLTGGVQAEVQWVDDSSLLLKPSFMNHLASVSLTAFGWLTGSVRHEWTTGKDDPSGKTSWTVVEGSARICGAHLVSVSYGAERGGQVCSGGICRIIEPFEGIRFTVSSNL